MGVKANICVFFFLCLAVVLVSGKTGRDPQIGDCKIKCEQIRGAEQDQKLRCKQQCEQQYQEKQGQRQGGRGGGSGQYDIIYAQEEQDIQKMVEECHQGCQGSQGEQQRPQCFQSCMQKQFQEHQKRKSGDTSRKGRGSQTGRQQQQSNNPYVFQEQHFTAKLETEQGNIRFLQKFTDRSDLFQGIEKYRVAFLEAEPQTFVMPNHFDADALVYVVNGEGTITLINQDSRQTHNIKRGDIFHVPSGLSVYLINRNNNERLVLAKILRTVSVPGELQTFFSVGVENPESSIFNAFSTEVLEAAFNTDRDSLERLFNPQQQQGGVFKKVTEEQIKQLTGKDEVQTWPFGEKKGPYNIYKNKPTVANENGVLYEVDSDDYNELKEINVAFSLYNITQGSMAGPFYHAKATVALVVTKGEGMFEMACPHLSEQQSSRSRSSSGFNPSYQKVSSNLRRGTVVVVPAGHPVVIEAANQDLEIVSFGLKTDKNEWFPLAGRDNVMSQWEDEAIELAFGVPVKEVQQVIQKQNQRLFFKGPVRRGRAFA
ncbi:vicilin-like antimicrobial peptides 2-2 [Tanacetum coccineum]|uniref:Vicilin-like antimicrobial peptides 2-2 n=1 Tax=Tanacetum coccineum TaxID=301880 RepID=A0ABQ5AVB1_9ASTR